MYLSIIYLFTTLRYKKFGDCLQKKSSIIGRNYIRKIKFSQFICWKMATIWPPNGTYGFKVYKLSPYNGQHIGSHVNSKLNTLHLKIILRWCQH